MAGVYRVTHRWDDLEIVREPEGVEIPVRKRGASGMLGQLFSRRFVVVDEDGGELFQVVDGNPGTYPRASLVVDGREVLALAAGGRLFKTVGAVSGK